MPGSETLRPVAWTFGVFGGFWGTWAVAAVDAQRRLHLSDGGLGLVLTVSVVVGGLAAAAFSSATNRMGTAQALSVALGAWGTCVLGVAVAPGRAGFFVLFVAAMVVAGTVDAAMNTAVALGARGDGGTMVRFHALFNAGALVGAGTTGLLLFTGATWRASWAVVAGACFALALVVARAPLPGARSAPAKGAADPVARAGAAKTAGTSAAPGIGAVGNADSAAAVDPGRFGWRAVRTSRLTTLAGAFFGTALVEGGIDTWGVLYLRTHLRAGPLLGAGAYALGQAIAVTVRTSSARHVRRIGARAGLITGTTVAAAGLVLEAAAGSATLAGLGLLVALGGIALCWPLVMAVVSGTAAVPPASSVGPTGLVAAPAAGARPPGAAVASLVGAFTAVGYLGWVAGPGIVGWVADSWGLGTGLALLAAVAAAAAVLLTASPVASPSR